MLHYIMRNIFLAQRHYENQELESTLRDLDLKSGVNQENVKSESIAGFTPNQFDIAIELGNQSSMWSSIPVTLRM